MLRRMLIAWLPGAAPAAPFAILLLALALDAALGDPGWLYRAVPHPVALFGRAIAAAERTLNRAGPATRFRRGLGLTLLAVLGAAALGRALEAGLAGLPGGWAVEALLASTLIAGRGLHDHVAAVARALGEDLDAGRAAVGRIVGRDPASLDEAGVARAAAESLAENWSDGVVAPAVWFALFGLAGLAAYKAVNTLDSMIGYRNARYADFGRAAAHLDDAVNWLPARLAGLVFVAAAALLPGASAAGAWRALRRDAPRHRSPNAGWQEAALAGALGFALAGPRRYGGRTVDDHWMGDGRSDLTAADLGRALALYRVAGLLLGLGVLVLAAALSRQVT